MARANRHFLPGHVWHITHRCHEKEFLLKFPRDRQRWLAWLFEAKKRYGLDILNYTVTSNHIHLLVQ
jgi:putative transposase